MDLKRELKEVKITMEYHEFFFLNDLLDAAKEQIESFDFDKTNTYLGLEKYEWEMNLDIFETILIEIA